jgi:hypothetical protein
MEYTWEKCRIEKQHLWHNLVCKPLPRVDVRKCILVDFPWPKQMFSFLNITWNLEYWYLIITNRKCMVRIDCPICCTYLKHLSRNAFLFRNDFCKDQNQFNLHFITSIPTLNTVELLWFNGAPLLISSSTTEPNTFSAPRLEIERSRIERPRIERPRIEFYNIDQGSNEQGSNSPGIELPRIELLRIDHGQGSNDFFIEFWWISAQW